MFAPAGLLKRPPSTTGVAKDRWNFAHDSSSTCHHRRGLCRLVRAVDVFTRVQGNGSNPRLRLPEYRCSCGYYRDNSGIPFLRSGPQALFTSSTPTPTSPDSIHHRLYDLHLACTHSAHDTRPLPRGLVWMLLLGIGAHWNSTPNCGEASEQGWIPP